MYVEIKSSQGINPRSWKDRVYCEQQAALHVGADFPVVFRLNVEQGHEYAAGHYQLDPSCFVTDQHGNLQIKRVRLVPTPKSAAKAAG